VLHEFARREPSAELAPEVELSEQQAQVLQMVAQGRTYREIGDRLGYAERTIKKYMGQMMSQLHLKNRAEVVAYAQRSLRQGE